MTSLIPGTFLHLHGSLHRPGVNPRSAKVRNDLLQTLGILMPLIQRREIPAVPDRFPKGLPHGPE
jgi:hypothetical protein